jgi:hypothetical protein
MVTAFAIVEAEGEGSDRILDAFDKLSTGFGSRIGVRDKLWILD